MLVPIYCKNWYKSSQEKKYLKKHIFKPENKKIVKCKKLFIKQKSI